MISIEIIGQIHLGRQRQEHGYARPATPLPPKTVVRQ
jgi:hypothetical protein